MSENAFTGFDDPLFPRVSESETLFYCSVIVQVRCATFVSEHTSPLVLREQSHGPLRGVLQRECEHHA